MKIFICIISLVFVSLSVTAQHPGYQGKHFFFEAGVSTMVTFRGPTANNRGLRGSSLYNNGLQNRTFALSTRFRAGLYWTFSRKNNLRLNYDYAQTGLVVEGLRSESKVANEEDRHDIFFRLHAHSIDLGIDIYMGRVALAPLGMYITPSLKFIVSKGKAIDQRVYYANSVLNSIMEGKPNSLYLNDLEVNTSRLDFAMGVQWGYRNVLFDRLTLNFAVEGYLFPGMIAWVFGGGGSKSFNDQYYGRAVVPRLQSHYLINIHIGVGVLLF